MNKTDTHISTPEQTRAQLVTSIRMKAIALRELLSQKIESPGRQESIKQISQDIGNFFVQPDVALEFIGAWYAVNFEYAPLIHALGPVLARAQQAAMEIQQVRAPAIQGPAPVLTIVGKEEGSGVGGSGD